jgi:hypothetical protein
MERGARPVFDSVGVTFEARNYAMGGTASFSQMGTCLPAIMGLDVDILSWDYGMTDVYRPYTLQYYCARAASSLPNHPACVGIHVTRQYHTAYAELEERGMAMFYMDDKEKDELSSEIPDTLGLNTEQIEAMPPYVRYFRCGRTVELGEPKCGDEKYTMSVCPERSGYASWHPGWKAHALVGNLMAIFLLDLLEDAVQGLANTDQDPVALLEELQSQANKDHEKWMSSDIPPTVLESLSISDEIDPNLLLRGVNYCHTAVLPSDTRYKGILTETNMTGMFGFEEAMLRSDAEADTSYTGEMMRLVQDYNREHCERVTRVDYKDFFFLNYADGLKKMIVPNDREFEHYGAAHKGKPLQGYVSFCLVVCDWGQCPEEDIRADGISSGKLSMKINGLAVTGSVDFGGCDIVRHEGGFRFPLNKEGRIEVEAKVLKEGMYMRYGSFTVW